MLLEQEARFAVEAAIVAAGGRYHSSWDSVEDKTEVYAKLTDPRNGTMVMACVDAPEQAAATIKALQKKLKAESAAARRRINAEIGSD